jgi:hypothetical protein
MENRKHYITINFQQIITGVVLLRTVVMVGYLIAKRMSSHINVFG